MSGTLATYAPIALTILASVLYQVAQRAIPGTVSPFALFALVYGIAVALCWVAALLGGVQIPGTQAMSLRFWPAWLLAGCVVGIEIGYLLAYRAGWTLGTVFAVASTATTVILALIGLIFFGEILSARRACGLLLASVGLWLLLVAPARS